jgi:hypothetical protein
MRQVPLSLLTSEPEGVLVDDDDLVCRPALPEHGRAGTLVVEAPETDHVIGITVINAK